MPTNQLAQLAAGLLMAVILGGWLHHGSPPPSFEGATWKEALAKVPCQDVVKDGKDLKITGIIVVDGESSPPNPTITKEDLVKVVENFPKH
jgi:hypothetical protein